jgi:hypothetical protein
VGVILDEVTVIGAPRIALVTTVESAVLHDDFDRPFQDAAFAANGIACEYLPWDDASVDWDAFDLVMVRSPWNYATRLAEFRRWLSERMTTLNFHNPAALISWNLDKRYLGELAAHGVSIVPTTYAVDSGELREALSGSTSARVVVKPVTSAGSRLTGRFESGSPNAVALGEQILAEGLAVMVQGFAESVDTDGEIGTVVFDGAFSHSFRKGPLLGDEGRLRGGVYREEIGPATLADDERRVVTAAHSAVRVIAIEQGWIGPSDDLLYGRYDVIRLDDGSPALLEAELVEPSFFLGVDPQASTRLVEAVLRRL